MEIRGTWFWGRHSHLYAATIVAFGLLPVGLLVLAILYALWPLTLVWERIQRQRS